METTVRYTPEQKGAAERLNHTLMNKLRPMLASSGLPTSRKLRSTRKTRIYDAGQVVCTLDSPAHHWHRSSMTAHAWRCRIFLPPPHLKGPEEGGACHGLQP